MMPNHKDIKQKNLNEQQEAQMKILMQKLRLLNNKYMYLTFEEKMSEIKNNFNGNIFVKIK
jgi:hypothetical protein